MTENRKKMMIVGGVALAVILLLLWKSRAATAAASTAPVELPNVQIPAFNVPIQSPYNINIGGVNVPGLPQLNPYEFQAISPCMCNGSSLSQPMLSVPGVTIVENAAPTMGAVYNYAPASSGGCDWAPGYYAGGVFHEPQPLC